MHTRRAQLHRAAFLRERESRVRVEYDQQSQPVQRKRPLVARYDRFLKQKLASESKSW